MLAQSQQQTLARENEANVCAVVLLGDLETIPFYKNLRLALVTISLELKHLVLAKASNPGPWWKGNSTTTARSQFSLKIKFKNIFVFEDSYQDIEMKE